MDDMLLFADDRRVLRDWSEQIGTYTQNELHLEIKDEATLLAWVRDGVPFLGMRLWPRFVRLDGRCKVRIARKFRDLDTALGQDKIDEDTAMRSSAGIVGWASYGRTLALRRAILEDIDRRRRDKEASNRVNRGGSWNNNANNARSGNRNNNTPGNRNNNIGFRLASSRPSQKTALHGARSRAQALTIVPLPAPQGARDLSAKNYVHRPVLVDGRASAGRTLVAAPYSSFPPSWHRRSSD